MSFRKQLLKLLARDTRGTNPNSLANLKYINAEGEVKNAVPAAAKPTPPPPVNQTVEFFAGLRAMEDYRASILAAEDARREAAIKAARASMPNDDLARQVAEMREMIENGYEDDGEDDEDDGILERAAGVLMEAMAKGSPSPPPHTPPPTPPPPSLPVEPTAQDGPQSTFNARAIVERLDSENPGLRQMVRDGVVSKKAALKRLMVEGFNPEQAAAIYEEARK